MAPLLTKVDRSAWLAGIDRTDALLVEFARAIDEICETALEQTGRELPVEHAAAILLRTAAETEPGQAEERLAA